MKGLAPDSDNPSSIPRAPEGGRGPDWSAQIALSSLPAYTCNSLNPITCQGWVWNRTPPLSTSMRSCSQSPSLEGPVRGGGSKDSGTLRTFISTEILLRKALGNCLASRLLQHLHPLPCMPVTQRPLLQAGKRQPQRYTWNSSLRIWSFSWLTWFRDSPLKSVIPWHLLVTIRSHSFEISS